MTVTSCLALQPTHWHLSLSLSLSWPVLGFFLPFSFSLLPLLLWNTGVSLSLRPPLKRCGVFVRPDKGCHSSPFPLLCGPGLAAPVEVQMVSSRRGYPRGPWRALSLLQAWLITTLLPLPCSPHQLPGPWNHGRHIPTTSTWPSFLLACFDGWHPSLPLPPSSSSSSLRPTTSSLFLSLPLTSPSLTSLSHWLSLLEVLNCFLTLTNCSCWKGRCRRGRAADVSKKWKRRARPHKVVMYACIYSPLYVLSDSRGLPKEHSTLH